ncbi:hypothetical protein MCEMSEM23_00496 [Rhabdaerophilaceae bacterium]
MVNQVKASSAAVDNAALRAIEAQNRAAERAAAKQKAAEQKAAAKPEISTQAVESLKELDARAFMQRQQIGAALYDRSLTFEEGARVMKRQEAISAYAAKIQAKEGGPTEKDLVRLDRKLDRADAQILRLTTNAKGADLNSVKDIAGEDLNIVQENLMNRINAGIKDGSLTEAEAKGLLARQNDLNKLEEALRSSDGKFTAGEQKQMLDALRKETDLVNRLRHNSDGVNATYKSYSDGIDNRQSALEKQLAAGIKAGTLTEDEAVLVRAEFDKAAKFEEELRADGKVDWRDAVKMGSALNEVEIALYDLQRNTAGKQLADSFVDQKYVDLRQAGQLESLARGVSNNRLTNDETTTLLNAQQAIADQETAFAAGGLTRGEYLRLQTAMNSFSLLDQELQSNSARYTGLIPQKAIDVSGFAGTGNVISGSTISNGGSGAGSPASGGGNGGSGAGSPASGGGNGGSGAGTPVSGGGNGGSGAGTPVSGGGNGGSGAGSPASGGGNGGTGAGTPVSGGGNGGSGAGTPASGGDATPAPAPVPPVVETPAEPVTVASAPAVDAETAASENKPAAAVDQIPADPVVLTGKIDSISDRFAEFMSKAMESAREQAAQIREELQERREARLEEAKKDFDAKDKMANRSEDKPGERPAFVDERVRAYARPAAPVDPIKAVLSKVA